MLSPIENPYRVPLDGSFKLSQFAQQPPEDTPKKKTLQEALKEKTRAIYEWQRKLYAEDRRALLLVFQAMDAAGKDSTIRHVLSGVNPAGFQVASFKQPSSEELDHDFLWRVQRRLPERGRMGVFNRSHYEEVLVVRVHPEYLNGQRVPNTDDLPTLWKNRFGAINGWEKHLAESGTTILKFFLNISKAEQKKRFLDRLDTPRKQWKFSAGDVAERKRWDDYMHAYEEALKATSKAWAPWYCIPADDKPFMRLTVATIIEDTLSAMNPEYPGVSDEERAKFSAARAELMES